MFALFSSSWVSDFSKKSKCSPVIYLVLYGPLTTRDATIRFQTVQSTRTSSSCDFVWDIIRATEHQHSDFM